MIPARFSALLGEGIDARHKGGAGNPFTRREVSGERSERTRRAEKLSQGAQRGVTGRTAENAANLRKGDRLLVTGSVVTDSWADKTTGEVRYATRVLAQSVGVALTFARVTGIDRNSIRADA